MKNRDKNCIGCQALCNYVSNYAIYKNLKGEIITTCPCIECIVKAICEKICYDYSIFELKRHELHGTESKSILPHRRIKRNGFVSIVVMAEKEGDKWLDQI